MRSLTGGFTYLLLRRYIMNKVDLLIEVERALEKSRMSTKRYVDALTDLQNDLYDILIAEHRSEIRRLELSKTANEAEWKR